MLINKEDFTKVNVNDKGERTLLNKDGHVTLSGGEGLLDSEFYLEDFEGLDFKFGDKIVKINRDGLEL